MTRYQITAAVGFHGSTYPCSFGSTDPRWHRLSGPNGPTLSAVSIPTGQFAANMVVDDEVRFMSVFGRPMPCTPKRGHLIRPGGTVVILESPHKDEYIRDPFSPIGPLQKDHKFQRNLESIVWAARKRYKISAPNSDIIFCNPVQFQASLAHLFPLKAGIKKMPRDDMWNALYGISAIRNDFVKRLTIDYQPQLIIEACTGKDGMRTIPGSPKESIHLTLLILRRQGLIQCPVVVTGHPSWWDKNTFRHIYLL